MKFNLKSLLCFVTISAPICFLISYAVENNRLTKERNELLRIEQLQIKQLLIESEANQKNMLVEEKQYRSRLHRIKQED